MDTNTANTNANANANIALSRTFAGWIAEGLTFTKAKKTKEAKSVAFHVFCTLWNVEILRAESLHILTQRTNKDGSSTAKFSNAKIETLKIQAKLSELEETGFLCEKTLAEILLRYVSEDVLQTLGLAPIEA